MSKKLPVKFDKVKVMKAIDKVPLADALSFFKTLADAYKEEQITKREIAKVQAIRDILIYQIKGKHEIIHKICDAIFEERKNSIDKIFSIIDKGIETNNDKVITQGLESLSTIVSSSPFKDINVLSNLLESGGKIEM